VIRKSKNIRLKCCCAALCQEDLFTIWFHCARVTQCVASSEVRMFLIQLNFFNWDFPGVVAVCARTCARVCERVLKL